MDGREPKQPDNPSGKLNYTAVWVKEAVNALGLPGRVRHVSDEHESAQIVNSVKGTFVSPHSGPFWWEHLQRSAVTRHTDRGYQWLPQIAPTPDIDCWLITGLDMETTEVFRCTPADAATILGECPPFEYALVDLRCRWMVIENHHDVLIAVGEAAVRLERLR